MATASAPAISRGRFHEAAPDGGRRIPAGDVRTGRRRVRRRPARRGAKHRQPVPVRRHALPDASNRSWRDEGDGISECGQERDDAGDPGARLATCRGARAGREQRGGEQRRRGGSDHEPEARGTDPSPRLVEEIPGSEDLGDREDDDGGQRHGERDRPREQEQWRRSVATYPIAATRTTTPDTGRSRAVSRSVKSGWARISSALAAASQVGAEPKTSAMN